MGPTHSLREYVRSSAWPERSSVQIALKDGLEITLDIPNFGVVECTPVNQNSDVDSSLTQIASAHATFRAGVCFAKANVINLFFPDIKDVAIRVAFTAWLAFACVTDDIGETLEMEDRRLALLESIEILKCAPNAPAPRTGSAAPETKDKRIQNRMRVLYDHCTQYLPPKSAEAFFHAVCDTLQGQVEEIHFPQQNSGADSLALYMSIRARTISLNPFFAALKSEYLTEADLSFRAHWDDLENAVCRVAGLQNDLIGLVRDLEAVEQLNAVVVLMRGFGTGKTDGLCRCVALVNAEHNRGVTRCLEVVAWLRRAAEGTAGSSIERVETVARCILMLCETHLRWCASAKRYRLKVGLGESVPQCRESDIRAVSRPFHAGSLSDPDSGDQLVHAQGDVPQQLPVQSRGHLYGLPTFPNTPDYRNLTALVTGATGLSGYHMVKVLAASPQRWSKIYCLSSRPPPPNFFADLGEDVGRVEHLVVDLLNNPSQIAQQLKEIQHGSHLLLLIQAAAAQGWFTLFNNFLDALRQTSLKPRRFMLQTGTKHYGFYLGPTVLPAYECDPRVQLDRIFYYEQEDALTVARPSYIIGAVRDGALNHLLGFGVYAASTGTLTAYFEEWLVLAESTANEAFNIHNGLSFTWGRLWPMLAGWYNAGWCPPEEDERKYRVMKLRCAITPRGYGPQTTLRSTFTIVEWSQQAHIQEAWQRLAA
ncbi:NAD(P)-binding-like protein [Chaetomium strumarium]|uniref:NAD(P)-binding-like protein n=1 Tax=Chaetomium strumarium TaxID=1170767 RepID=A0AAJ0GPF7_9PEZI|nr:NAD(P)-binding-like protein [Chaetomium strumarium]